MNTDITLNKIFAKMSEINPVIIADIDDYTEIPQNSHFKGVNLNDRDLMLLLDIHIDKLGKMALKSNKPIRSAMLDDGNLVQLGTELISIINYEPNYPDLDQLKRVWFTRKSFGRSKIQYIKAQLKK
jgi:hypothetical protein